MPYISIKVAARPDAALAQRIATGINGLTQTHLRKDPSITAIAIDFAEPDHWFAGGRSLREQGVSSFWLDIKVVDGSNTKDELADYIAAVFDQMNGALGGVHNESYALVHEVPAAAYGFGGRTQEHRFISTRLAQSA